MANTFIRVCTVLMLSVIVTLGSPSELKQVDEPKINLMVSKDKEGHTLTKRQFSGYNYNQASSLAHGLNFNNVPNSAGYNYAPVPAATRPVPQLVPKPQIVPAQLVHELHQSTPLVAAQQQLVPQFLPAPAQLAQPIPQVAVTAPAPLTIQVPPAPQAVTSVQQIAAPQAGVAAHASDPLPSVVNGLSVHRTDTPEANDARPVAGYVQLYKYAYPFVIAAQLDNFIFSCRQDNGFLVINEQLAGGAYRNQQINGEFVYHPIPGLWWFVKCVGFESGYGLDMTGVSKPGGDAGIDPNALKSLIG